MRSLIVALLLLALLPEQASAKKYQRYKKDQIGEYYEYDVEGSKHAQKRRKARYRAKKITFAPAKSSWHGLKNTHKIIKKTSHALEAYLRGEHQNYNKKNLNKALTDWEGALRFEPHGHRSYKKHSSQGPLYVPRESWRLLKYSLYQAGFRFPKAVKKTLKNMVYGTFNLAPRDL
jgi:hypothetical protein